LKSFDYGDGMQITVIKEMKNPEIRDYNDRMQITVIKKDEKILKSFDYGDEKILTFNCIYIESEKGGNYGNKI